MKIYIHTDLEGAAMVSRWDQTRRGEATPESRALAMKLMTWELNAAVDGILDVDSGAEVIVWDGHGGGGIDILEFHANAKLISRSSLIGPPYCTDDSFDALFFVAQHAMAGTAKANLCHTYSGKMVEYYKINGKPVGEFGARAIMAGTFGIPTVFISGDDKAVAEAKALVPGIHGAVVKEGLDVELAVHLSPKASQELIRRIAAEAVKEIDCISPVKMDPPYVQEIKVKSGVSIVGYLREGAERVDERTLLFKSDDICDLRI